MGTARAVPLNSFPMCSPLCFDSHHVEASGLTKWKNVQPHKPKRSYFYQVQLQPYSQSIGRSPGPHPGTLTEFLSLRDVDEVCPAPHSLLCLFCQKESCCTGEGNLTGVIGRCVGHGAGGRTVTCWSMRACCCCRRTWSCWGLSTCCWRICCICWGVMTWGVIIATDTGT